MFKAAYRERRRARMSIEAAGGPGATVTAPTYMRLEHGDANRFFQLINRRYTRSSMIVTSNKRVSEWAELFGDEILAVAILDRLLHDAEILTINGPSWRLRGRGDILADNTNSTQPGEISPTDTPRQPRREPQKGSDAAA